MDWYVVGQEWPSSRVVVFMGVYPWSDGLIVRKLDSSTLLHNIEKKKLKNKETYVFLNNFVQFVFQCFLC